MVDIRLSDIHTFSLVKHVFKSYANFLTGLSLLLLSSEGPFLFGEQVLFWICDLQIVLSVCVF